MAGLKVKIGADASQFERTMRGVRKDVGGVKKAILGIGAAAGAIYAANKAFDAMRGAARGAFEFIKESSKEAATLESLGVQFETLLGGATAAKKRMEEIVKFAASTPFQIEGLAEASAMLQGMTGGALATGDGLRLVGDAAAAVNKPLEVVGMNIGKLFQGLTEGGEVAEATNQLMQYGLVTGKAKIALQDFVKAAKAGDRKFLSSAKAVEVLSQMFGQTEGAMGRLSETTSGKISIMRDNIDQLQAKFGQGFNDGLKSALDASNEWLPQISEKFTNAGEMLGGAISKAVEGNLEGFQAIGVLIGQALKDGLKIGLEQVGTSAASTMLRGISKISYGIGGKQFREFLNEQADLIDQGGAIGRKKGFAEMSERARVNMQNLRAATITTEGVGGSTFRPAKAGEVTPFYNPKTGERLVQVMESIDRKLTLGFPN
jgi:hypothetical protein